MARIARADAARKPDTRVRYEHLGRLERAAYENAEDALSAVADCFCREAAPVLRRIGDLCQETALSKPTGFAERIMRCESGEHAAQQEVLDRLRNLLAKGTQIAEEHADVSAGRIAPISDDDALDPPQADNGTHKPTLRTRTLEDIEVLPIHWRWTGRIPEAALIELCGLPGVGKSALARYVAARYSTGERFPQCGESHAPATVLYCSGEDDVARVLKPSLLAMGADLTRIEIVDGVTTPGEYDAPLLIPCDLPLLESKIVECGAKIVILDPLSCFWDGDFDSHKESDVRPVLARMAQIAERTGCTILSIRHLNKSANGHAVHKANGSGAFTAAARVSLAAGRSPQDPEQCVLASIKSNLGPDPAALEYKVTSDSGTGAARISWGGESGLTAGELFAEPVAMTRAIEEAAQFLQDELAGGQVYTTKLQDIARQAGISWGTIKRAASLAGATSHKEKGQGGKFYWELDGKVAQR